VEHGGAIMKFPCKWGMFSDNEDIVLDGENPSAEADDCGGSDETRVRAINLVHMNGLMECDFMTKGAFKEWIKEGRAEMEAYLKKDIQVANEYTKKSPEDIEAEIETTVKAWRKGIQEWAGMVLKNWKNVMVFFDKNMDCDGAKAIYIGDEEGDNMYFVKCLYREDKQ